MGLRNYVLEGGPAHATCMGILGEHAGVFKSIGTLSVNCAKMTTLIKKPFGKHSHVGARNHVLISGEH